MIEILGDADDSAAFQVIHSDLAGNVLFADGAGLPPAVIDISPQLRSVCYAGAILVTDAVAWNGAPFSLVEHFVQASSRRRADVARAVIFRVATAALFLHTNPARVAREADGYRLLLTAVLGSHFDSSEPRYRANFRIARSWSTGMISPRPGRGRA